MLLDNVKRWTIGELDPKCPILHVARCEPRQTHQRLKIFHSSDWNRKDARGLDCQLSLRERTHLPIVGER